MQFMKAAVLTALGGVDGLEIREVPKPHPKPYQVLVRVYATSVNPVDYQIRRGDYKDLVTLPNQRCDTLFGDEWLEVTL